MAQPSIQERTLALVRKKGLLRPKDLDAHQISRVYLSRLCAKGLLERRARGIYSLPNAEFGAHDDLAEICRRIPRGVIALVSALEFHELTTQIPSEVWVAIDHKARAPRIEYPPTRIVRFSKRALTFGVQTIQEQQVELRVYSPAKTIADCFRFRNKVGQDVAIEALRECRRKRLATMDELWEAAQVCRMSTVMRPWLEASA